MNDDLERMKKEIFWTVNSGLQEKYLRKMSLARRVFLEDQVPSLGSTCYEVEEGGKIVWGDYSRGKPRTSTMKETFFHLPLFRLISEFDTINFPSDDEARWECAREFGRKALAIELAMMEDVLHRAALVSHNVFKCKMGAETVEKAAKIIEKSCKDPIASILCRMEHRADLPGVERSMHRRSESPHDALMGDVKVYCPPMREKRFFFLPAAELVGVIPWMGNDAFNEDVRGGCGMMVINPDVVVEIDAR